MRGNPAAAREAAGDDGSIPAYAGEPPAGPAWPVYWRVYPRVCGGTGHVRRGVHTGMGLSPRMRGNRPQPLECRQSHRSIPAYAGEPDIRIAIKRLHTVYPRVCGGTGI